MKPTSTLGLLAAAILLLLTLEGCKLSISSTPEAKEHPITADSEAWEITQIIRDEGRHTTCYIYAASISCVKD